MNHLTESIFDPSLDYDNLAISFNSSYENDVLYNPFGGWIYSTTEDLMKWLTAIHEGKLISKKSYQLLSKNYFFPEKNGSLGRIEVSEAKQTTIHHWGGFFNYISLTYVNLDKNLFIVLLSNNGCRELLSIAHKIDSLTIESF